MALSNLGAKLGFDALAKLQQHTAERTSQVLVEQVAPTGVRDVVADIARINAPFRSRPPQLLQAKFERMAASPHAYFRGAPQIFYRDLAAFEPTLFEGKVKALLQGDAHLGNLGTLRTREGSLGFGLVDFDESAVGDVKADLYRNATSVHLTATEAGLTPHEAAKAVKTFARSYHDALKAVAHRPHRTIKWPKFIEALLGNAGKQDPAAFVRTLAETVDGAWRLKRGAKLFELTAPERLEAETVFKSYLAGLTAEDAKAIAGYTLVDAGAPIAGVSSLGRRRYRVLLAPKTGVGDPLLFELKEQLPPAMGPYVGISKGDAQRTLDAARAMTGTASPFLGAAEAPGGRSFLVKRMDPGADSFDLATLHGKDDVMALVEAAGWALATSHAGGESLGLASADRILQSLGDRRSLEKRLGGFAKLYAPQVQADHAALVKALATDPLLTQALLGVR